MAWTGPYIPDSFKKLLLDLLIANTLKAALYDNTVSFTAGTAAYTTSGEIVGTGYTAGGVTLVSGVTAVTGNIAYLDYSDPTWVNSSFITYGSQFYCSTASNKTVLVIDFGGSRQVIGGTFSMVLPAADNTHAIIRIV